jgi:ribose-phosphate pyrophosphokinase
MLDDAVARVVILDTIPPERLAPELVRAKLHAIDATGLFAEAIAVLHSGGSIVDVIGG